MTTNIVSQRQRNATVQQKRAQQTPTHKAWYRDPSKLTKIASLALASVAVLYALSRKSGVLEGDFTSSSDPVSMNSRTREQLSLKLARIINFFLTSPELANDPNLQKALNLQLDRIIQALDPSRKSKEEERKFNEKEVGKCREGLTACLKILNPCRESEKALDDKVNKETEQVACQESS